MWLSWESWRIVQRYRLALHLNIHLTEHFHLCVILKYSRIRYCSKLIIKSLTSMNHTTGLIFETILGVGSANERWRYKLTSSLWASAQYDLWLLLNKPVHPVIMHSLRLVVFGCVFRMVDFTHILQSYYTGARKVIPISRVTEAILKKTTKCITTCICKEMM